MNAMKFNSILPRLGSYISNVYGLDYRSLALFRIVLALVILVDLAWRFSFVDALYSDAGVLPRSSSFLLIAQERWSVFFLNGTPQFSFLLLLVGLISAGFLLVGWHTRAATIILWILVASLQSRNANSVYGADTLIRLALFWGMFLPLGAVWSFDNGQKPGNSSSTVANLATFGLLLQNVFMYATTALLKDGPTWREDYNAVYYALSLRDHSTWLGDWLFHHAPMQFFTLMTVGTIWVEFAVPIMLLVPVRSPGLRIIAVALVISFHLGISFTLAVGLFPMISIACSVVVLPSEFWDKVGSIRLAKMGFRRAGDGRQSLPADAVSSVAANIAQPAADTKPMGFLSLRALNAGTVLRASLNLICLSSILLGLMWNLMAVSSFDMPQPLRRVAIAAGLYQDWAAFAPDPRGTTVWYIVVGTLSSGEEVDLLVPIVSGNFNRIEQPRWDQTNEVWLRSEPWRKYLESSLGWYDDGLSLADYACRNWNATHRDNERLETVTFTIGYAVTMPDRQRAEPAYDSVRVWNCG